MKYKTKTYVIFDADKDNWAYNFMKGWNANRNMDFKFKDAHEEITISERASEETVRRKLRARFSSAKNVIVLVGEKTKYLYRFVRWEIEVAIDLDLPIIVANLNCVKTLDNVLCPNILKTEFSLHIPFKMKVIKFALNHYTHFYYENMKRFSGPIVYGQKFYNSLKL